MVFIAITLSYFSYFRYKKHIPPKNYSLFLLLIYQHLICRIELHHLMDILVLYVC